MLPRLTWLLPWLALLAGPVHAGDHAVVLLYHHVDTDTPASTSTTPERFEAHLDYLAQNGFEVWSLERLLRAVIDGAGPVPEDVVAITFDDAYESVFTEARPRLAERGWPFTVFVNTDAVDAGHRSYMSWEQLRELANGEATLGNHSATHAHLVAREADESESAWRERVTADIDRAHRRIEEETGQAPGVFAYPYGEDSPALAKEVGERYDYALAQRSGAVGADTDPLSVPRFPMATGQDDLERFALAVNARPLPVTTATPEPPGEGIRGALERLTLELDSGAFRIGELACYAATGEKLAASVDGEGPWTVEIDVGGRGSSGRNKINCTAPAADGSGDYFWYAFQWIRGEVRD